MEHMGASLETSGPHIPVSLPSGHIWDRVMVRKELSGQEQRAVLCCEHLTLFKIVQLPLPTSEPLGVQKLGNLAQSFFS